MIAVCSPVSSGFAQSASRVQAGPILGVFDETTGEPISGVQVRDDFSGVSASTTSTGTVRLSFLSFRGKASFVRLTKLGYAEKTILVAQGDTTPITEVLERLTTLAPVVTTERYRLDRDDGRWNGFGRRCGQKLVTCFTDSTLAARGETNMADVLLRATGVTLGACGTDKTRNSQCGRVAMHSAVIPPAYCEPSIFVDGFWWNPHFDSPIDMRPSTPAVAPFTAADIKGVEVYETGVSRPLRFEGDPLCGAIVIWTK